MKRFLLLVVLIPRIVFAEDVYFKVIETTPTWDDNTEPTPNNINGKILEGSIVKGYLGISFSRIKGAYDNIPFQSIFYDNKRFQIYADSVIPLATQDLFDENVLYSPERPLTSPLFMNALRSSNLNLIYLHDKTEWDEFLVTQDWREEDIERFVKAETGNWFLMQYISNESMRITQTTLSLYSGNKHSIGLLIKNIIKTKDGYNLTVKGGGSYFEYIKRNWKWSVPEEREFFTVLLVLDGDYLDLYLENKNNLIDTFGFVNKEFNIQFNNLKLGYPVDLTNVKWPHRSSKQLNAGEECRVLEDLKLMENPETAGAVITTMEQGSKVTIQEIGQNAVIDGVSSPWVKVQTNNGETGWCFGLYLRETRFDPTPEELAAMLLAQSDVKETENNTEETGYSSDAAAVQTKPFKTKPVLSLIIGIASGIAVVTVILLRRKRKLK
jgi:hypothetical protein